MAVEPVAHLIQQPSRCGLRLNDIDAGEESGVSCRNNAYLGSLRNGGCIFRENCEVKDFGLDKGSELWFLVIAQKNVQQYCWMNAVSND